MKLKQWLPEYKGISYADYKLLPDIERWELEAEFKRFNRSQQLYANQSWRPMTREEKNHVEILFEKERIRYETSITIGGIDERGNYTALSHRWENN